MTQEPACSARRHCVAPSPPSTCLSMPVFAPLPKRAPSPAPIAMPRNGMKEAAGRRHIPTEVAPPDGARATQGVAVLDVRLPFGSRTTSAASLSPHGSRPSGALGRVYTPQPVGFHLGASSQSRAPSSRSYALLFGDFVGGQVTRQNRQYVTLSAVRPTQGASTYYQLVTRYRSGRKRDVDSRPDAGLG